MKNYLITGSNSFLGTCFANYLSSNEENRVLITSRAEKDFSHLLNERVKYLPSIDLLKEKELNLLNKFAVDFFTGKINVVNCTGYYGGQEPMEDTSIDEAGRIMNSNFTTIYNLASKMIPTMINKGGGHFVAFSCNSVKYNYPQMAPFTAAKSAVESLYRTIANEYYHKNIFANCFQLATLLTDNEIKQKPYGDQKNWLKLDEVVRYVENFLTQPIQLHNGNSIQLYHHSESFFHQSYFDRIKR